MAFPAPSSTRTSAPDSALLRALVERTGGPSHATTLTALRNETAKHLDGADSLLFIDRGAAKLVAHVPGGREQIVSFHFEKDLVYLPARPVNEYSLCALADCTLLSWPVNEMLAAMRREAGAACQFIERLFVSLELSREKSVLLGRKTAQERLASFLISMASRIGSRNGDRYELILPMSRRDIADSLGLTIETVSRQLTDLREMDLIATSGRSTVILLDIPRLRGRAGLRPASH